MSRALGYGYNQCAKWERGFKRVYWSDLLAICDFKRLPISEWIVELYEFPELKSALSGKAFLKGILRAQFAGDTSALGHWLDARPSTLRRWLSGETDLPLETAVRGMAYRPRAMRILMSRFGAGDRTEVPERKLGRIPFAPAVQHYYAKDAARTRSGQDPSVISRKLHLSREQIQSATEHLVAAGLIAPSSHGYLTLKDPEEFKGVSQEDLVALMRYWMYRAVCSIEGRARASGPSTVRNARSFKVFTVSAPTANEISRRLHEAYLGIQELIDKDPGPADSLRALIVHHFDAADCPHVDFESDRNLGLRLTGPKRASRTDRPAR